ncbi:AdoMet dependent proline di-methyltransferase-domain-containing protein [Aspergillus stella-maris]|uniref:AdoMet dependent proline di-methyltransferase-domain-containing protein n=1 Tax=Aspergillus stella-maris TaxID=1810926 RepID=UPI003CCCD88B
MPAKSQSQSTTQDTDQQDENGTLQPNPSKGDTNTKSNTTKRKRTSSPPPDSKIDPSFSLNYWASFPATTSTMLGAFGDYPWYTRIDLRGSKTFVSKVRRMIPGCSTTGKLKMGVDCGAGVGRVTEGLLRDICEHIDAVEPVKKFADVIISRQKKEEESRRPSSIGDIYITGIENWIPTSGKKYDLIWTQFCANYITDEQLVLYLERCRDALSETGFIVLKENVSTDPAGRDMFDEEDSSVTRTDGKFRVLMGRAGLVVLASEVQMGFPREFNLLPVRFYALRLSE